MPPPPPPPRAAPPAGGAAAIVAGGVLTAVGAMVGGGPLEFLFYQRLAIAAAGVAAASLGGLSLIPSERARPALVGAALVVALIALGLGLDVGFGRFFRGGPRPYLVIAGALLVAAGSAVAVYRATARGVEAGRVAALAGAGATILAVAGTLGPWIGSGTPAVSGLQGPIGKLALVLALVLAGTSGALAGRLDGRVRSVLSLAALVAGVILAVFAFHTGGFLGQRAGVGWGLYLVAVGSVVGAALAAQGLSGALGLRRPGLVEWVVGALVLLGGLNLVLGFALADRLRDLDVPVFSTRIGGIFLILVGVGLVARQAWAWLLGFPVAVSGLVIAATNAIRTEGPRSIPLLVALLYANVLRALWQARGRVPAPVPYPDASSPGMLPPPDVPPAEAVRELPEDRTWQSDPALREVLDPLNRRDHAAAAAAAERLVDRFPDLDLIYSWWGKALLEQGDTAGARAVLERGIERSRRKYVLCERLGEVEWRAGDLDDAVRWWAQSVHGQESLAGAGEVGPYLYLAAVGQGMGLHDVAADLLDRADRMRAGQIRLEEPVAAELRALASRRGDPGVEATLRGLRDRYLARGPQAAPSPDVPAAPPAGRTSRHAAPSPGPSRMVILLVLGGILLLAGGVALGVTVFGGDERVPAAADRVATGTPSGAAPGQAVSAVDVVTCLTEKGFDVEQQEAPLDPIVQVLTFETEDDTTVVLAVYPSIQAAEDAAAMLGEQASGELGLVLGNVITIYAPPPTAELRRDVEGCVVPT
ncbi:MAG: hypothetical protein WD770_09555 [Actinomycetota bacterium]